MIVIAEVANTSSRGLRIISRHDSFEEACEVASNRFQPAFFEIDEDNPNCADFISARGVQYVIEPMNRGA